jgi:hypothetical protein
MTHAALLFLALLPISWAVTRFARAIVCLADAVSDLALSVGTVMLDEDDGGGGPDGDDGEPIPEEHPSVVRFRRHA